jgi:hypothetical protein
VKQKNDAYSIVDESNIVLKSFYADGDADAYVDAYLHAERLGCAIDTFSCRLVHHRSTVIVDNPFDDAERAALRLAAKFCSAMTALASFRAMRTLATTMRVGDLNGMRCAIAKSLFDNEYRTGFMSNGRRKIAWHTGEFYFESDLTKTMLDFVDWMASQEQNGEVGK